MSDILKDKITDIDEDLSINDLAEEQIYPMNDVKVDKGFYTVFELKRRYDSTDKRIILDSSFQRDNVWSKEQKSELVESVLMGLPLPIFYFNQDKYGKLIVVDGRQRLTAMFEYMDGKYALGKLRILSYLNGKHFSDLPPVLAGRLEDYQIQAHVILPPTPDRIKFDIFDRVNRGGTQLNKQEIRNALYQGKATELLNRITASSTFADATGMAFKDERKNRMKDRYLINRFLALYLFQDMPGTLSDDSSKAAYVYKGDIDDLLGKTLDVINHQLNPEILAELEAVTLQALSNSYFYLGSDAFRIRRDERKTPINMNAFETIMMIMCSIHKQDPTCRERIRKIIFAKIGSPEFLENIAGHRDGAPKLQWRLALAVSTRNEVII